MTEMNDPVTPQATANITSGAGNLTQMQIEAMRQGGANQRQSQQLSAEERMHQLDQEFNREMIDTQQTFTGEQNQLDREKQLGMQESAQQFTKEENDAARKFDLHLQDYENKRAAARVRYESALNEGKIEDADSIANELTQLDTEKEKADSTFRKSTLAIQMATGKLNRQIPQIQQSSAQMATGINKVANEIRETIGNGVSDALIEGITTDSFKDFFRTSKFTPDSGVATATGNVGQQLIDSFMNGPAMGSIMQITDTGDVGGATASTRAALSSLVRASGAIKQGSRLTLAQQQDMQQAVDQMRQHFDDHEIDSIISSFADSFNSASTGFKLADLDTAIQGKKIRPTKEAEKELRNTFNVFAGVGQFRKTLGLKSAGDLARDLETTIPDTLNRLEELSPDLVDKILKQMPKEAQIQLRKDMLRAAQLQHEITQAAAEAEGSNAQLSDIGNRAAKVKARIGKSNEKTRKAKEDYASKLDSLVQF